MIQKYRTLLEKEFENLTESLTFAYENLTPAIEWFEYLSTRPDFEDIDTVKEMINGLKSLTGDIAVAKLRIKNFKEKSFQIFDKKYLC